MVSFLDYRLKNDSEKELFEIFIAENLATISSGNRYKERMSYKDKRDMIWGIKHNSDTRTAKEIIEDTFAARGVKVNWKNKGNE